MHSFNSFRLIAFFKILYETFLLILLIATIITSCSQQKFTFRKKIKVDSTEQPSAKEQTKEKAEIAQSKLPKSNDVSINHQEQNTAVAKEEITPTEASIDNVKPNIQTKPEWKQAPKEKKEVTLSPKLKKGIKAGESLATAALVLGILGIVFFWLPILGFLMALMALIFGILALKSSSKGMAIAGIVLGALGSIFGLLFILAFVAG